LSPLKSSALTALILLLISGCSDTNPNRSALDGKLLLKQKCAQCHNLQMPPETSPDEPAPPMMAVTFNIKGHLAGANPAETKGKFLTFIGDYVMHPSADKSFCDAQSLKKYGVMPSQKENVTPDELTAIAIYAYEHYDRHKFLNILRQQSDMRALPKGEQLARKYRCLTCHSKEMKRVGPSFKAIASKYSSNAPIIKSITQGSHGKWEGVHATMPSNPSLTPQELQQLSSWIRSL